MALSVGDQAPNFTLPACDGQNVGSVTLSEAIGQEHVVLAFFPLAFTAVCRAELCEFKDQLGQFNQLHTKVFGISVDSPFSLNAFSSAEGFNFELLSDFNKEVSAQYGVLYETLGGFKGVSKRSVFLIDRSGTVQYAWVSEDAKNRPNLAEVTAAVKKLG